MKIARLLIGALLLLIADNLGAATLDEYYLSRLGAQPAAQMAATIFLDGGASTPLPAERCGTPLTRGLRQDWHRLTAATQVTLAKYLAAPVLTGEQTYISAAGHFAIHYATSGADAPLLESNDGNTVPDWVETVATVFEETYAREVAQLGYKDPLDAGITLAIYLENIGSHYLGVTDKASPTATTFITIDNDFAEYPSYTSLALLQITAAHEFHHAIQLAYTYWFDLWYAEASATWIEDELYDDVNQLYAYLPPYYLYQLPNNRFAPGPGHSLSAAVSVETGGGYGRWGFNRYLTERFGVTTVRQMWQSIDGASNNFNDIDMLPYIDRQLQSIGSSLADAFTGFAKRMYLGNWTSHVDDLQLFPSLAFKKSFTNYPVTAQATFTALPAYSFAAYSFTPKSGAAASDLTLTISHRSVGIELVLFQTLSSGTIQELRVDQNATALTVSDFYAGGVSKVVLLVVNASSAGGASIAVSTDGSLYQPVLNITSSSDSGGGCFIATAAYGSYLHPKVQVLRNFRDCCLLNNRWGRAFVAWYYRWSPAAATGIAAHPLLKLGCCCLLTPLVYVIECPLAVGAGLISMAIFGTYWRRRMVRR